MNQIIEQPHAPVTPPIPTTASEYYAELTTRNRHFVRAETQARLTHLKMLVAGCGSTGGACTESLARVGVCHFTLADNGAYELNNLNRQHAFIKDLGRNKALVHAEHLRAVNPNVNLTVFEDGVTRENVKSLVRSGDIIMDAVDVTTYSGIQMKIALHEEAHRQQKPVFTALDLGFCQWGKSYDYRNPRLHPLNGRAEIAKSAKHPMKALFLCVPISAIPAHVLPLVIELLERDDVSASQVGCTSDLLAAIIVPSVIRFVETGELVSGWNVNLENLAYSWHTRITLWREGLRLRRKLARLLAATP